MFEPEWRAMNYAFTTHCVLTINLLGKPMMTETISGVGVWGRVEIDTGNDVRKLARVLLIN